MDDDDDAVGYGRPPKAHRFKPGQSGKPSGRPRGALNRVTKIVHEVLAKRVEAPDGAGGTKTMPLLELQIRQLFSAAISGDLRAIARVLEYCAQLGVLRPSAPAETRTGVLVVERYMAPEEWAAYWENTKAAKRRSKPHE